MKIYLDIETLPTTSEVIRERIAATIKPPANYKKPESIAQWHAENGHTELVAAVQKTALEGTWGSIACIGWAVNDGPVNVTQGATERETLEKWAASMTDATSSKRLDGSAWWMDATWIGHNIQDFDLRFLWQRTRVQSIALGFPLPMERFSRHVYDTMREWAGYNKFIKQADLELALGLERHDPLESGADVATASPEDIAKHCAEDVRLVREIYRRMKA